MGHMQGRERHIVGAGVFAAACLLALPAAGEDLPFSYTITDFCTIQIVENGVLAPSPDLRRLRSRVGDGGSPARLDVLTSAGTFTLTVNAPSAFTSQPAANTTPETFRAPFRSTGATVFAETETPQVLGVGSSNVRVVLIAQKAPGDVFPAGNYSAIVPVLCE